MEERGKKMEIVMDESLESSFDQNRVGVDRTECLKVEATDMRDSSNRLSCQNMIISYYHNV